MSALGVTNCKRPAGGISGKKKIGREDKRARKTRMTSIAVREEDYAKQWKK